jgi:hypothetical protein
MASLPGFVGPFDTTRSRTFNAEDTINLYVEGGAPGTTPKTRAVLYGTPGVAPYAWFTAAQSPTRGLFSQDGRCFGVSGAEFGEIPDGGGAVTNTGIVAGTTAPVSFSSNGTIGFQVTIFAGGLGYVFATDADTLTQITDPDFPADVTQTAFFEGYTVALVGGTRQFNISALGDSLDWDGLDIYERNIGSDNFLAMVQNHRELWFFGTRTSLVYTNTGDASTPLQPIPGVLIEQGILAPWSAKRLDNAIAWIGQDEQGQAVVYLANGYSPQRISTHAVEHYLAQSADLSVAEGITFQYQGHLFYALYVPDLLQTIVYDVSQQTWIKIAWWQPSLAQWTPHVMRNACSAFGTILVGDRQSATVYRLSIDQLSDDIVVGP